MVKLSPKVSILLGLIGTLGFGWMAVYLFLEPPPHISMSDLEIFTGAITGTHEAQVSFKSSETQIEFSTKFARPLVIQKAAWIASLPITRESTPVSTSVRIGLLKSELNTPQTNIFGRPISFEIIFLEVSGTVLATPEKYSEWMKSNNRDGQLILPIISFICAYLIYDGYQRKKFQDANPWAVNLN